MFALERLCVPMQRRYDKIRNVRFETVDTRRELIIIEQIR